MTLEGTINNLKSDLSNVEDVAKLYGLDHLTYGEKEGYKRLKENRCRSNFHYIIG